MTFYRFPKKFQSGAVLMLVSCFFFSVMNVGIKYCAARLPLFEVVFFRCVISSVIFGLMIKQRGEPLRGYNEKALFLRSLVGYVAILLNFYAISKIPLADASILGNSSPLFVVLLSSLFFKEKISRPLLFFIAVSMIGLFLVLKPGFHWLNAGSLSGLAAGFFAAVAFVTISQLHATESSLTIAFYFMTIASLGTLPLMLPSFRLPVGFERVMLLLAGFAGTLGQLFLTMAYRNEKASWISALIYVTVLFAFGWGILIFREIPDSFSIVGTALVIIASVAIIRLRKPPAVITPMPR